MSKSLYLIHPGINKLNELLSSLKKINSSFKMNFVGTKKQEVLTVNGISLTVREKDCQELTDLLQELDLNYGLIESNSKEIRNIVA